MIATMEQTSTEGNALGTFLPDQAPSNSFNTPTSRKRSISPARSTASSLTDVGTSTPVGGNSPIAAFALLNGVVPPAKKRKLTFAEQEEKRILKQIKEAEKAEEKARRESEKKQREFDKAKRDAEREEKRLIREAEKAEKDKEKMVKDEERRKKEDGKRKREEEKLKAEEDKRKKEEKQFKLNAFFTQKSTSITETASPKPATDPEKGSEYERAFPPFFVKEHVRLAESPFKRERWGSADPEKDIDDYLSGRKALEENRGFDASCLFNCPDLYVRVRGRNIMPVRDIMAQVYGGARKPIDLTNDSQKTQVSHMRDLLRQVPYKVLKFYEDVRPPYNGTNTSQPIANLKRLARHPLKRNLPSVNYEYDSEAEWVDEAEDGEDVESDADEEEDDIEDEEDADGFLDDTDDQGANMKNAMQGDLEPKSTGLSWEDEMRRVPLLKMYGYHMELMNDNLPINTPIDPFSTCYWEDATPAISVGSMDPPRVPLNAMKSTSSIVNGPGETLKMFGITSSQKPLGHALANKAIKKLVADEDMTIFREEVQGNQLSKVGLIEVLHKKLNKSSKAAIKYTLETLARRVGTKEAEKKWVLNDDTMT